jgi:hypothetical protein
MTNNFYAAVIYRINIKGEEKELDKEQELAARIMKTLCE